MHAVQPPLREAPLRLPRLLHPGQPLAPFHQRTAALAALLRNAFSSTGSVHAVADMQSAHDAELLGSEAILATVQLSAGASPDQGTDAASVNVCAHAHGAKSSNTASSQPPAGQLGTQEAQSAFSRSRHAAAHAQRWHPAVVTCTRLIVVRQQPVQQHSLANEDKHDEQSHLQSERAGRTARAYARLERLPAIAAAAAAEPVFSQGKSAQHVFAVDASLSSTSTPQNADAGSRLSKDIVQHAAAPSAVSEMALHSGTSSERLLDVSHALLLSVERVAPCKIALHYRQPAIVPARCVLHTSPFLAPADPLAAAPARSKRLHGPVHVALSVQQPDPSAHSADAAVAHTQAQAHAGKAQVDQPVLASHAGTVPPDRASRSRAQAATVASCSGQHVHVVLHVGAEETRGDRAKQAAPVPWCQCVVLTCESPACADDLAGVMEGRLALEKIVRRCRQCSADLML